MLRVLRSGNKRIKLLWWAIAVVTVATFIGGFIFLFGAGLNPSQRARTTGAIGTVNGQPITRTEWTNALTDQRTLFQRNYGIEPADRDLKMVEVQTWRALVTQRLLGQQARAAGLAAHDHEVVIALETSPPQSIVTMAAFQTDGKFDPQKYRQALGDPNQNWSPVEDMVRDQLPVRKLQERLLASIKLTEPELKQAYRDRFEKLDATVLQIAPDPTRKVPPPSEADLQRLYEQYKGRFSAGARTQLEVLVQPKKYGDEEIRAARETALGLVRRARAGEDFAALARDYSEGPGADKGGAVQRVLTGDDFGAMGPKIVALAPGEIADPFQDNGRFVIIKVLDHVPPAANNGVAGMHVAQIVVKVRPNDVSLKDQYDGLVKLRGKATSMGLGKAAAAAGLATQKTNFYDANNLPQQLFTVPEAGDWGLAAKKGQISPVFDGVDEFVVVQVAEKHDAGAPSREEIGDRLRDLADMDARISADKTRAETIAAAIGKGQTLEQAAKAQGLSTFDVKGMTRANPDPRLFGVPELVGTMFAAPSGKLLGPVRGVNAWYFVRLGSRLEPNAAQYDSLKGNLTTDILSRRQNGFFSGYLSSLRSKAKVEDLRSSDPNSN
jgi:peptidyl-prolyl cis-trans isomerase D